MAPPADARPGGSAANRRPTLGPPPARPRRRPAPLAPGDAVAVVSASWPAPAYFPAIHEQAMERVRDELGLEPVELPTTRRESSPQERAADLNRAFADPDIRAVLATIGGDDQITVLPHLDPATLAEPTWFAGYSDNTNLLNWLWFHGVQAIHGGATQVHLGPGPGPHADHVASLRAALFGGDVELVPQPRSHDWGIPWEEARSLVERPDDVAVEPWTWAGAPQLVRGPTWGGCLEVLEWTLAVGRFVHPAEAYAGCVLVLEPTEERPSPLQVYRMLRNIGERGLLGAAVALLWGRPMVTDQGERIGPAEAARRRAAYREVVRQAVEEYHPGLPLVLDVDFGHTTPQWVLPYGGEVTVDGATRRLLAHF